MIKDFLKFLNDQKEKPVANTPSRRDSDKEEAKGESGKKAELGDDEN